MTPDVASRYIEERLPRYTSYPTAVQFSPTIDANSYNRWLAELPKTATASLYLHIPFCRSMCWYCACNTTVAARDAPIENYLVALRQEIRTVASKAPRRLKTTHIHFGGGTPTIVPPVELMELGKLLRGLFDVTPDAEWAIEVDPRTLTPETTNALGAMGMNRTSLGVQSFDRRVQQAINRTQGFRTTANAAEDLRAAGVTAINLDLVYGLPHQTVTSCLETVQQCLTLHPDRFSVFGYAHVPSFKKHQQKIDPSALPDSTERMAQANAIASALVAAGYVRIGMDHFALPSDPMTIAWQAGQLHRNFQGYTPDASDVLIGLGASAIGRLPQGYVQNTPVIRDYSARTVDGGLATSKGIALSDEDRLRGEIIERIMCDFSVDLASLCANHKCTSADIVLSAPVLAELNRHGVVSIDGGRVTIRDEYKHLVRVVAAAFDAYSDMGKRQFSRVV